MTLQVTENRVLENGARYFEFLNDKGAKFTVYAGHTFTSTLTHNSSHAAYKGMGRTFHGSPAVALPAAREAYKSEFARAALDYVIQHLQLTEKV